MSHPHLELRGTVFGYRRKIPLDLVAAYGGRREIRHSLRTRQRSEAERLTRLRAVELDQEFARKRRELERAGARPRALTPLELTDENIRRLCVLWMHSVLDTDDQNRSSGFSLASYEEVSDSLGAALPGLREAFARGNLGGVEPALQTFLHMAGVAVDAQSPEYGRLRYAFLQCLIKTAEFQTRRQHGEVVRTSSVAPEAEAYTPQSGSKPEQTFDALFNGWLRRRIGRPESTIRVYRQAWSEFRKFIGHEDGAKVTKADVRRFVQHLETTLSQSFKTVSKKLGIISTIFAQACKDDVLALNPTVGVEVVEPAKPEKARVPYTLEHLQAIFSSPVFTEGDRPRGAGGEAAYWLPVLGHYTGARLEELGQLRECDVLFAKSLGWYLEITDEGVGRSVKNVHSRRQVPLRQEVVNLGFMEFVESIRRRGISELFPDLVRDCKGSVTGNFSKWWGRYARAELDITDKRRVFHSLRHGFKAYCRLGSVPKEHHDRLTGHTGHRGASDDYGDEMFPLPPLFDAMSKVAFPSLSIPKWKPADENAP